MKALLHERIEPRDRLIQNQQLGIVHERLYEPELLAIPGRQLTDRPPEVSLEPLGERESSLAADAAADLGQVVEDLSARQLRVERELTRQKADPTADLETVGAAVEAENRSSPRSRPDQVEQEAHRRRLAGAVRPEESENLAGLDLEIEIEETPARAVILRKPAGENRGGAGSRHHRSLWADLTARSSFRLDGESEVSEDLDRAGLPALEITRA